MGDVRRVSQDADVKRCVYCGFVVTSGDLCNNCRNKLPLVRKLVKMLKPYRRVKK